MIAATLLCLVISVSDGDTLTARCNAAASQTKQTVRVRLHGIDAPERGQPYGRQARRALQNLVLKKTVALHCHTTDTYQRRVCTVWTARKPASPATPKDAYTQDVGLSLIKQGMAWWYRYYAHEQPPQQREQYRRAEQQAKRQRTGLWRAAAPVAPWDWRRKQPR